MKNTRFLRFVIILLVLTILTVFFHYRSVRSDSEKQKEVRLMLADRIYDAVAAKLNGPVLVGKTMAGDVYLIDTLLHEKDKSEEEMIEELKTYLEGVRESSGSSSAFIISDTTNRYYTFQGLNKVINPKSDSHDVWYPAVRDSKYPFVLNVDTDQVNSASRTIFVDTLIHAPDGELLGVCGIGFYLQELQNMFLTFERTYNCKVNLVDETGLVEVDVDSVNVENTWCDISAAAPDDKYHYISRGMKGFTVIKYLEGTNWYLVLSDNNRANPMADRVRPGFMIWCIFLFLLISFFAYYFLARPYRRKRSARKNSENQTDPLTGLFNRNYFKGIYGERGIFNTTRYKSIAVFDIDFFKEANDTLDGDEILLMVTRFASQIFKDKGEIFRWGGDEFMLLLEPSVEPAYDLCKLFCSEVERDGRVTISLGITEVRLSDAIKKNYYRAAQGCYLVKEMGGNGVKRN